MQATLSDILRQLGKSLFLIYELRYKKGVDGEINKEKVGKNIGSIQSI